MEEMTDKQFDKIMKMVSMILDGCKDLDEAKEKIKELAEEQKKRKGWLIKVSHTQIKRAVLSPLFLIAL